ncbi:MAG: efflux RND transporter periplasmic adaptor subunit [Bacteroidota bacterium]|nr:efflux RND transporter periplasmic adaptor subunit [Bacteroidota bacterium]
MRSIISILIITTFLFSCKTGKKEETHEGHEVLSEDIVELNADQIKMAGIEYGQVEQKTLSNTLNVNGIVTVSPQNLASVCAPLGGIVKSTSLTTGASVKKGQALAILENPEFIELQRNYLESRSKLEYAESEYKRHSDLYKSDVYSKQNVQQVTADYQSLKVQVSALAQKLALIGIDAAHLKESTISRSVAIASPINGFIKTMNVNIGKSVSPSDVMFEIVNTASLTLELTLFEKDINKIAVGQKLRFSVSNGSPQEQNAVVTQTGKAIASDKTVKVYASAANAGNEKVLPGMYVNARIETSNNPVTALPTEAIVRFDEKDFIFVFDKTKKEGAKIIGEFRMVQVKRGVTNGNYTEVLFPENFNLKTDKIVTKGSYNLLSAKKNAGDMAC